MSASPYYSKKVQAGELDALKEKPLTKQDLEDMPRIIQNFVRRGMISYKINIATEFKGKKDE